MDGSHWAASHKYLIFWLLGHGLYLLEEGIDEPLGATIEHE
jgi:hypothetical protein